MKTHNIIREIKVTTSIRYHCTHTRMAKLKRQIVKSVGKDVKRNLELSDVTSENAKWNNHFWKMVWLFFKKENIDLLYDPPKNLVAPTIKRSNAGDQGSIPGSGRSPGKRNGNPLQHSCLENPMDRGSWWVTVHGVAESDTTEAAKYTSTKKTCTQIFTLALFLGWTDCGISIWWNTTQQFSVALLPALGWDSPLGGSWGAESPLLVALPHDACLGMLIGLFHWCYHSPCVTRLLDMQSVF